MVAKKKPQKSSAAKKKKDIPLPKKTAEEKPKPSSETRVSRKKSGFDWKTFLFGHDKITRSDWAEIIILVAFSALLLFIILKSHEII